MIEPTSRNLDVSRQGVRHTSRIATIVLTLLSVMLPGISQAAEDSSLKIINWNVLYGFNHHQSIEEASEWLNTQHPDVIAFQELNGISEARLGEQAGLWDHFHAVTHKEDGFPVGLTSNEPIDVIAREFKAYHHGFLHCKSHGIHFFVVHFWPGKFEDVNEILYRATQLVDQKERVIILGDFNGCSRKDEAFLTANATKRNPDYTFVDLVEAKGFVDLVHKHDPMAKISCPSPITIPEWSKDWEELQLKRYRIDFIFSDPLLAKYSTSGTILLAKQIETISDHYPVVVELSGWIEP
jgi:exodeoxyribonuclease-3